MNFSIFICLRHMTIIFQWIHKIVFGGKNIGYDADGDTGDGENLVTGKAYEKCFEFPVTKFVAIGEREDMVVIQMRLFKEIY